MARYDNILETIGNTPLVKLGKLAPPGVNVYVKVESFNPMGSVKDRMARAIIERRRAQRRAETRANRHRSHERQHRHRARDGLRAEGLPARGHDGRELQRRAPQAAALPRRQGRADAGVGEGQRHAREGRRARRGARLVPLPAIRERSECRRAHAHDGAGNPRRLRRRAPRLLGLGLRHRRHAERRGARAEAGEPRHARSSRPSPTTRRCSAAASRSRAAPTATRAAAIRIFARTSCRAGRRTSSRS